MKSVLAILLLLWCATAAANPPCPERADSMEGFSGCLIRTPGGSVLAAGPAGMGSWAHANSAAGAIVPPPMMMGAGAIAPAPIPPQISPMYGVSALANNIFWATNAMAASRGRFYYPSAPFMY